MAGPQNIFATLEATEKHGVPLCSRTSIAIRKLHNCVKGKPPLFECGRFHRKVVVAARLVVLVAFGEQVASMLARGDSVSFALLLARMSST